MQPARKQPKARQDQFDLTDQNQKPDGSTGDMLGFDFERIAMRRAQKQASFRRKEVEEEAEWINAHGGHFSAEEHQIKDSEKLDSRPRAALDAAFITEREEQAREEFFKPTVADFRLKFDSPHE